ncbi:hypothetical protein, partial [Histophilus somni]
AMGKGSKIEAEISNAVAIGANNHLRGKNKGQDKHTVAIGSDNIITGRKVVNLGSENKIGSSENNYKTDPSAGAVSIRVIGDNNIVRGVWNTVIGEENKFTDSSVYVHLMGDKNTVTDSKNTIILGDNNIVSKLANSIIIGKNITAKSNVKNDNNLIVMGNQAQATNANNSVVIGASAKSTATSAVVIGQGAESKAQSAVVLGKGATVQANATGAVAIGEGASVSTNAGNSIALGKGSQATAKANAKANATVEGVNFAFAGGTGNNKTVLSIGKAGTERVIKHVAAGEVSKISTDAINGSQLFSVTTEFAKLAKDVLGAELGTTNQFKKSAFKTLKATSTSTDTAQNKTFREAINANIDQINKGLVFSDGTTHGTRQLGEKITIQAGVVDGGDYVSDNIKTNYGKDQGVFLIGIKKAPRFEKVTVTKDVEDTSPEMTLTTKKYVDGKLANVAAKFTVKGDTNGTDGKGYELNKDNTELNINGDAKNITTEVDKTAKKLTVSLNSALTGITSIGKDESNKITFNGGTTITAGGAGLTLANEGDKVKISNVADGTTANDAVNKSQLDTKQDKLTGTITANNGLQITSGDGKNTVASNITLGLETGLKDKIDNALSKTEAGNTYAKVDASNINNGNQTAWRNKLDVYSKLETTNEIAKAKETVTNGAGITVTETAAGNGAKTFKVALENSYKTKIDDIGTGTVSDKNDKTVTGGKVHEAIEAAKTDIKGKLYANTATFGLKGNDSQEVKKTLNNSIEIKG